MWTDFYLALLAGCALDLLLGDPAWLYHPVCVIGKYISWCEKRLRARGGNLRRSAVWLTASTVLLTALAAGLLVFLSGLLGRVPRLIVMALLSWMGLSARCLAQEAVGVEKALGRGLDALMPEIPQEDARERVMMLRMGDIDPNPEQPRRKFDAQALAELAASIRQVGVLQPILVTEIEGRYRIIAGERRWRAARLAEMEEIPAIVRPLDEIERMEAALIENIQREDLNPLEEALAVRALMEKCGLTQEKAAERLGRSRPAVANLLRLLTLPEPVLEMLRDGKLSAGHARALVAVEDPARCIALAEKAVREGWSVRQIEQAAQEKPVEEKPARVKPRKLPEFTEMEERLRHAFGMKASIDGTLNKGKITLTYGSRQELERLYDLMQGDDENA